MPLSKDIPYRGVREFHHSISPAEVKKLASDKDVKVLLAQEPADAATWDLLNTEFFSRRPEVRLVYINYGSTCDLAFLKRLSNVRRLAARSIGDTEGVSCIRHLSKLELLSLSISSLDTFEFLRDLEPEGLVEFSLGETHSKKPSLKVLEHFPQIETLYIEGQSKDVEAIGALRRLKDLTLRSVTAKNLDFLSGLSELWSLDIKLGGTRNLAALARSKSIKYLELWLIRKLDDQDLEPIGHMEGLQYLFLQALRNVRRLPDMTRLWNLRRLKLWELSGLESIESILTAPALEELIQAPAFNWQPEQYAPLLNTGRIRAMSLALGNKKKSAKFAEMLLQHGVSGNINDPFKYR